jgi:signal transduction histidine kinase
VNLILNALDVTEKGGRIEVAVQRAQQEGFLEVRVRDYGSGIPEHIRPFIFDPFFSTKPKGRGTGLGLSISKGIVQKHGGDLTVDTVVNGGTTFTLSLPNTSLPVDLEALKAEGGRQRQDSANEAMSR